MNRQKRLNTTGGINAGWNIWAAFTGTNRPSCFNVSQTFMCCSQSHTIDKNNNHFINLGGNSLGASQQRNTMCKESNHQRCGKGSNVKKMLSCARIGYLHRRQCRLKVSGGKVNEEGPDLFRWDGHSEGFVSTTPSVVWDDENTNEALKGVRYDEVRSISENVHINVKIIVSLTCFRVICSLPLPSPQTGDVPGSCERTLLQHFYFPYPLQHILFTQEVAIEEEKKTMQSVYKK